MGVGFFSITNLKMWTRSQSIMSKTLMLLQDLSLGFSSVRKLFKLDSIQFILANHNVCVRVCMHACMQYVNELKDVC